MLVVIPVLEAAYTAANGIVRLPGLPPHLQAAYTAANSEGWSCNRGSDLQAAYTAAKRQSMQLGPYDQPSSRLYGGELSRYVGWVNRWNQIT